MGVAPQPPRAPAPPPPPRSSSNIVAIVLLILALIIVVCGVSIYTGVRFLSSNVKVQVQKDEGGQKDVSIKTPVGNFEVRKDASDITEARLGLPIYPGATRVQDDGSASVSMEFPGENQVRIVAAKFETADAFDKVEKFYQDRIGGQVTKLTQRDDQGRMVFEIKAKDDDRVVALKSRMSGTRIEMVHVLHGVNQVN
jgi:hypothetical protein